MAQWYPEGYVYPTSTAYPPGPQHPAYTNRIQVVSGQPAPCDSSSRTPRGDGSGSTSCRVTKSHVVEPIIDCVDDVDFFHINQYVRVRFIKKGSTTEWSPWYFGYVKHPRISEYDRSGRPLPPGKPGERCYSVDYTDPQNGVLKNDVFYPGRGEIAPLFKADEELPVLAYVKPNPSTSHTLGQVGYWVTSLVMKDSVKGPRLSVKLCAGPGSERGRELILSGVKMVIPYESTKIDRLRAKGYKSPVTVLQLLPQYLHT
ncbi:hypothetical protein L218DRAFT_989116 [Marasmius fiardii PR-910]|nr:hypothetical protein L218DRAFT_989116 [Marasmius fiardii PR-910]